MEAMQNISIHVPREGDDVFRLFASILAYTFLSTSPARGTTRYTCSAVYPGKFLSTSPARGTTHGAVHRADGHHISIHVPREGDDLFDDSFESESVISIHVPREGDDADLMEMHFGDEHFYPRPPRGGRHLDKNGYAPSIVFLSTSPARGTTGTRFSAAAAARFLSTSPARGTT